MVKHYFFLSLLLLVMSCTERQKTETFVPPNPSEKTGNELAKIYCSSCHQFPEPNLLPKNSWKNGVLPNMALRMGMEADFFKLYSKYSQEEMQIIIASKIYPENPQLHQLDWQKIIEYYVTNAPEKPILQIKKEKPSFGLNNFKVKYIFGEAQKVPTVTCVKFNTNTKETYISWRSNNSFIKKFNAKYIPVDSILVKSPVSDIAFKNQAINILTMGIMDPNDLSKGGLISVDEKKNTKTLYENLSRPVQISYGDLNQDNLEDIVICNFGNEMGNLSWYEGGNKNPHLIKSIPGARQTYVKDMNGDKIPDIVVLMTQAREGVSILYNKGKGIFDEKQILSFPSVYGSSHIDLIDFNKDGFADILYSNGDNADLSMSLKAFHGVRIFLNDGKDNYKLTYFYPMHGVAKAIANDFDLDGDLDIAAISFFTDPNQSPHEGFLLLNNQGNNQFKVSTFKEANSGKWMVMDVGDIDQDGDSDIILGSFLRNGYLDLQELKFKGKNPPSAIILENKKIK